jgi:hypothetical protein
MELTASKDELTGRWTLHGLQSSQSTFDGMLSDLKTYRNFKFARYGDGEANCMKGKKGHNCDGHEYFPDLGLKLRDVLEDKPTYMIGVQPLLVSTEPAFVKKYFTGLDIYDADVLHSASIDGRIPEFMDALHDRSVMFVGPFRLMMLADKFQQLLGSRLIDVPEKNCWTKYEKTIEALELALRLSDVVLLSCGMMAECIIHHFRDYEATFIDCGSVFDPYCGVKSRSYHHKL